MKSLLYDIDFNNISRFLPSEIFIYPFIQQVKTYLNSIIFKFQSLNYFYFDLFVKFIMDKFNSDLHKIFNGIPTLDTHIAQIDNSIQSLIIDAFDSSNIIKNDVSPIITALSDQIPSLAANGQNLSKFNHFDKQQKLMKVSQSTPQNGSSTGIKKEDMPPLPQIYLYLDNYKRNMTSYSSIQQNLEQLKTKLTIIQNINKQICKKINGQSNSIEDCRKSSGSENPKTIPGPDEIYKLLMMALYLKYNYINKLDQHTIYVNTLEQIGSRISYLKSFCSSKFKDKLDDEFCNVVNELKHIKINYIEIYSKVVNIKTQIDQIIKFLELTKLLLEYKNSIEMLTIRSVFVGPNIKEFLDDSLLIIKKFSETSKSIDTTIQEIKKLKGDNSYLSRHIQGDLESTMGGYNEKIKKFLKNAIVYIKMIRYIIYELLIIRSHSVFEQIQKRIQEIKDLKTALTNLELIYSQLIRFYYIQMKTIFLIYYYLLMLDEPSNFETHINNWNKIIYETHEIGYLIIMYYILLYHTNVIIKNMENLKSKIDDLNKYNKNINDISTSVSNIIKKLSDLNTNISILESNISQMSTSNIKDKIINYKYRIQVIKKDMDWLIKTFENIRSYIEKTVKQLKGSCDEITKQIEKDMEYFGKIIFVFEIMSIGVYEDPKYKNQIIMVLYEIEKHLDMTKMQIEMNIKYLNITMKILSLEINGLKNIVIGLKSNIHDIGMSVVDLECAIDGVPRNFIKCTLQSANNTIYSRIGSLGVVELEKHMVGMYSVLSVDCGKQNS